MSTPVAGSESAASRGVTTTDVGDRDPLRRTLVLVSAILCFETVMFTVLAPLLPHLAQRFSLSKSGAGVLVACYAAGALLGAIPSGLVAARIGAKGTAMVGLMVLATACIAFGLAPDAATVFGARIAQGVGCSLAWTGGLAWLVSIAPRARRGEVIGVALGAAVAGALIGPAAGAAASSAGTRPVFVALAVPAFALAIWGAGLPAGPPETMLSPRAVRRVLSRRSLLAASLLIALAGLLLGVISVLAPLRLGRLGWGAAGIATIFLVSAAFSAAANPLVGRWADRADRVAPLRLALVLAAAGSVALAWHSGHWAYAGFVFEAEIAYTLLWTPPMVLLADAAADVGFVVGFALMNLAWSPGLLVGSIFGGGVAEVSTDAVPYGVAAGLCLVALVLTKSAFRSRPSRHRTG
jgi:predicted MFS family arabinose efflux permease